MLVSDLASPLNSDGWDGTTEGKRKPDYRRERWILFHLELSWLGKSLRDGPGTTSSLGYDLQVLGQGSVSHRGEGQHSDVVGLVRSQTLDSDEVGATHHLLLPLRNTLHRFNKGHGAGFLVRG